jgi:uncharacterized membrane protein
VFSITIVALSLASSQYSPRLLRNFMRDRPTQWVLGVFVGVFVYCVLVLRTIRGQSDALPFVPSLAVLVGIGLALIGIGLFVYFIHHVADSIQAASILSRVAEETHQVIDRLYPKTAPLTSDGEEDQHISLAERGRWPPVMASSTGYIVGIDFEGLADHARSRATRLYLQAEAGSFVVEGHPLLRAVDASFIDDAFAASVNRSYTINHQRTIDQDVAFGIQQIVDVALKALSPGINDTTTATMCVDRLTAILTRLADRRIGPPADAHNDGMLISGGGARFETLLALSFEAIRRNATGNPTVLSRLVSCAATVAATTASARRRALLAAQLRDTLQVALDTVSMGAERDALAAEARDALARLSTTAPRSSSALKAGTT